MGSDESRPWHPPPPPTAIVIYPDLTQDIWRHSLTGPSLGFTCGRLSLPASAAPAEARLAAEAMLAELDRAYYRLGLAINWHQANANGWITGKVQAALIPS